MVGRKAMRSWDSLFRRGDKVGDDKQEGKSLPSAVTPAPHGGKALSYYYHMMVGIMFAITHACTHPHDTMAMVSKKGARVWRHHGKFILILMLLTVPSSTATRLHERGGRSGGPVVLDDDSLEGSTYLIDAKSAVEYGAQFTEFLKNHLRVHGVDAKQESRQVMHGFLDSLLDEMGGASSLDDVEGSQIEQDRAQAEHNALDSLKGGSDDVRENHLDGKWQDSEEGGHGGAQGGRGVRTSHGQGPTVDPDYAKSIITNDPKLQFWACSEVQSLLSNLANATSVGDGGIKEGAELMAQVETYVEEFTPCQTPTSSCLAKALRDDSTHEAHECAPDADMSEGMCEEVNALRRHVEAVIQKYPGLGILDSVREFLGALRKDCKAVVPHGRRLAECPTIPTSGYYELTEDCSLSSTITVPADKTLTIVGIGNPTIDRMKEGQHFVVLGSLTMTDITLIGGGAGGDKDGGAIQIINGGFGVFTGCTFRSNVAWGYDYGRSNGGAVYIGNEGTNKQTSRGIFHNCIFMRNEVFRYQNSGGAVLVTSYGEGTFKNCTFEENLCDTHGGAVDLSVRAEAEKSSFVGCQFISNKATGSLGASFAQIIVGILIVFAAAAYVIYDGIVGASEIESTGVLPFHTLSLRTMTSYLQVASMLSLYKMTFPEFVKSMIAGQAAVSSPGEVITNIDCLGVAKMPIELFTAKQLIIFSAPLIMCAFLGVLFGVRSLLKRISGINQFIGSCLIGLNLMYPTLVRRAALIFTCRTIGNAQFLDEALDVKCYQGEHLPLLLGLGVPSILLYVFGFPIALLLVLRRLTKTGALDPTSKAYNRRWVARLGFLYAGYEKKYAYWEALVLLRKASLSGFAVFLSYRSTALQVVVALLILYLCHVAQIVAEPLEHDWHDLMESRSLSASLLILFVCMIGDASGDNNGIMAPVVSVLVTSVVFLVTLLFLVSSVRLTLLGVALETKNESSSRCVNASKFVLRHCCRVSKDDAQWENDRRSFALGSASIQLKVDGKRRTPTLGDIEMVDNNMWTQNESIDTLRKASAEKKKANGVSRGSNDGGIAEDNTAGATSALGGDDADAPAGWERHYSDAHGRHYYVNRDSGESVWHLSEIA
eukprot:g5219.t1